MNTYDASSRDRRPGSPLVAPHLSWGARKIPLAYGRHICGQLPIHLPKRSLPFESLLEKQVALFLLGCPGLWGLYSQPFTLEYAHGEIQFRYTPDFLVIAHPVCRTLRRLGFATWTVVEVKPAHRYSSGAPAIDMRLGAIREVLGLAAVCVTDEAIRRETH